MAAAAEIRTASVEMSESEGQDKPRRRPFALLAALAALALIAAGLVRLVIDANDPDPRPEASQSPWTKCSMASLWTGPYPARARVLRSYDVVSPEARMPAEIFRQRGI